MKKFSNVRIGTIENKVRKIVDIYNTSYSEETHYGFRNESHTINNLITNWEIVDILSAFHNGKKCFIAAIDFCYRESRNRDTLLVLFQREQKPVVITGFTTGPYQCPEYCGMRLSKTEKSVLVNTYRHWEGISTLQVRLCDMHMRYTHGWFEPLNATLLGSLIHNYYRVDNSYFEILQFVEQDNDCYKSVI